MVNVQAVNVCCFSTIAYLGALILCTFNRDETGSLHYIRLYIAIKSRYILLYSVPRYCVLCAMFAAITIYSFGAAVLLM